MAEIVNLRMARKARKRRDAQSKAAANRSKFGERKADRAAREQDDARTSRLLDGAKREPD